MSSDSTRSYKYDHPSDFYRHRNTMEISILRLELGVGITPEQTELEKIESTLKPF